MFLTHLNLWPVGGHAGAMVVLPPFQIILLVDGHQGLVELIVHGFHTERIKATTVKHRIQPIGTHAERCSPLIVGDIKVPVDGEEGLLQETDPLPFLLLRLFKDGFHLFHVAGRVGRHILQHFLVLILTLRAAHKNRFTMSARCKLPQSQCFI